MMNHENIVESVMLVLEATVKLHPLVRQKLCINNYIL